MRVCGSLELAAIVRMCGSIEFAAVVCVRVGLLSVHRDWLQDLLS